MSYEDEPLEPPPDPVTATGLETPRLPPPDFFDQSTPVVPLLSEAQQKQILESIEAASQGNRRFMADLLLALRSDIRKDLEAATLLLQGDIAGTRVELNERIAKAENALWSVNQSLDGLKAGVLRLGEMFSGTHELASSALTVAEEAKAIASGHHPANGNGNGASAAEE